MSIPSITGSPYYINGNISYINRRQNPISEDDENRKSQREENAQINNRLDNGNKYNSDGLSFEDEKIKRAREEQQKAIISRNTTKKDATINISQIIRDFRNTGIAIGTPEDIMEDVESYVRIVEKQVKGVEPDKFIIRSNLKNGAILLDKYISNTLNKESKVVENWVDAIFLQQVNYNYDENQINEKLAVKFPKKVENEKNKEVVEEVSTQKNLENEQKNELVSKKSVTVPDDLQLKKLFLKAKRMSYAKDYKTAMETFKNALDRAIEVKDVETESKILFEIGSIYDKNDYLAQALTSYNHSIKKTNDLNIKTIAHYSMAQIYDDVYEYDSAIDHYISTVSYAGETQNVAVQSTSLARIGKIYTNRYNREGFNYLTAAEELIEGSDNHKTVAYVNSSLADAHTKFNQPKQALKYYSTAVLEYDKAVLNEKVALNYKKAAQVMLQLNNTIKAKKLLQKAFYKASQTNDEQLMKEISDSLESLDS